MLLNGDQEPKRRSALRKKKERKRGREREREIGLIMIVEMNLNNRIPKQHIFRAVNGNENKSRNASKENEQM